MDEACLIYEAWVDEKKCTTCSRKPGWCNINTPFELIEKQRANGGAVGGGEWPPLNPDTARAGAC